MVTREGWTFFFGLNKIIDFTASKGFDEYEDEYEIECNESNEIIIKIEKQLNQKRKDADDRNRKEEIRQALEAETKRVYTEAKEMFDEQLKRALKRVEKRKPEQTAVEKPSPKRRQNIKNELRFSCDNETPIQLTDELILSEEVDALMQSDGGDDSNDMQENENTKDYTEIEDYVPPNDDEMEEDDDYEEEDEYELPKMRGRKSSKDEVQISETNYTVLESGDIALTTELVEVGEFPESEGNSGCHPITHA